MYTTIKSANSIKFPRLSVITLSVNSEKAIKLENNEKTLQQLFKPFNPLS